MPMIPKILVFAGSLRTGAFSIRTADAAMKELALQGAEITRISLGDYPLLLRPLRRPNRLSSSLRLPNLNRSRSQSKPLPLNHLSKKLSPCPQPKLVP